MIGMLAMLPRLKTAPPHQISSYLTLTKKQISNVFVKGIFGYLLTAPLREHRIMFPHQQQDHLVLQVVTSKSSCALMKGRKQKKILHVP
jgi:hypothetical protein